MDSHLVIGILGCLAIGGGGWLLMVGFLQCAGRSYRGNGDVPSSAVDHSAGDAPDEAD